MAQPNDPNLTADIPPPAADSLDAGLAAAFGPPSPSAAGASVLQELRHTYGVLRPVLLRDADGDSAHVVRPHSAEMPELHETGARYQLAGEIARGGMGAVLRGRDVDLGRDLAVKVLLEKHAGDPEIARRFIEEAQIGGQLQHPGIVPVYDIGRFGERPFFTMKLVKGRTLSALLSERADLADDRPRFLSVFLQVCQTLAYAHSKGVIHRDLKPANVMVGAFGEVQVMDWGLAKVLPEGGVADEARTVNGGCRPPGVEPTVIRTARSGGTDGTFGSDTQAGSLMGTPAYMPPEQANGDVELLDRRTDVFGLGAILCEILTGKPPYVGRSGEEVRRQAANGDQAEMLVRLDACGADAELLALAKTCLAPEPIDRPRDAKVVADALAGYLNGVQERLRQAEIGRAEAVVRAEEERKRRRVQLALAASVLLTLGLGGGGTWWLREQQVAAEREAAVALREAESGAEAALRETEALREQGRVPEALATAKRAEDLAARVGPAVQKRVAEAVADLTMLVELDKIRLAGAEVDPQANQFTERRNGPLYEQHFRNYGIDVTALSEDAAAERIRGRSIRADLLAALDDWQRFSPAGPQRDRLLRVVSAADPEPDGPMNRLRQAVVRQDWEAHRRLAADGNLRKLPPATLARLGRNLRLVGAPEEAVRVLTAAQEQYPGDFWINHELAYALGHLQPPRAEEAIRYYTAALAIRRSPAVYLNLGTALKKAHRAAEAEAAYRRAIDLQPDYAMVHNVLGKLLDEQKRLAEAEAAFRLAIKLRPDYGPAYSNLGHALWKKKDLAGASASLRMALELDPNAVYAHNNLGLLLRDQKNVDGAIAEYRQAIELDPKYAPAHNNLGLALRDQKDLDGAIAEYRQAIDLDPTYALAHTNLGNALRDKRETDAAIAEYRKAIDLDPTLALAHLRLGLALQDRKNFDSAIAVYRKAIDLDPTFALAHNNLGNALRDKREIDAAIAEYRQAIDLDPTDALPHNNLGTALWDQKNVDGAIAEFRKALDLDPKYATAHYNLGNALGAKNDLDGAIAEFRKALDLDPKYATAHNNLGNALMDTDDLDGAIAEYRTAVALDPKFMLAHFNLGTALLNKNDLGGAIAHLRRAVEIDRNSAPAHFHLGRALMRREDRAGAEAAYRQAIEHRPDYAEAHCNLGQVLQRQGRFTESLASYRRGHELGSQKADWKYPSAQWVREGEQLAAVEAKLETILRGDARPADDAERVRLADICYRKQMYHTAVRFAAEAFAGTPALADLGANHCYDAACCAALAGCGRGADVAGLDDAARAKLRSQALDWLRADLAAWTQRLASGQEAERTAVRDEMRHWQQDKDFAGVRDADALAKLPADERAAWAKLWADVAELERKAAGK